jgi:hypothetical protein
VGPEKINKRHRRAIGLTQSRMVVVARSGGHWRAAAARSRRRARCGSDSGEGEGNAGQQAAVGALLGPSGGAGLLGQ